MSFGGRSVQLDTSPARLAIAAHHSLNGVRPCVAKAGAPHVGLSAAALLALVLGVFAAVSANLQVISRRATLEEP
jgi:hypothetical protein